MRDSLYDAQLPFMVGRTLGDIGDELGRSGEAVRQAMRRRGIKREVPPDYRRIAEGMKASDAVQYLLDCIEQIPIANEGVLHEVDRFGLNGQQRRLMIALWDAAPAFITRHAMERAISFDRNPLKDPICDSLVHVILSKLRKRLPTGLRIETRPNEARLVREETWL